MARGDQWYAFADERWNDVNNELIDLTFVEKGRDDSAATHHPDVFSFCGAQTLGEFFDWLLHELETGRNLPRRSAREDVIPNTAVGFRAIFAFLLKPQHHIVRLPAPNDRIDRTIELAHAVVAGSPRPIQPIDSTIRSRDEAVGAGGNVDDYFSHDLESSISQRPLTLRSINLSEALIVVVINDGNGHRYRAQMIRND